MVFKAVRHPKALRGALPLSGRLKNMVDPLTEEWEYCKEQSQIDC
jgi:hypothetical protein